MRLHRGRTKESTLDIKSKSSLEPDSIQGVKHNSSVGQSRVTGDRPFDSPDGEAGKASFDKAQDRQDRPFDKTQDKQDRQDKPKRRRNWWKICCCSCVVLIVLFIFGITSALAASGLVHIPGLSQLFYKEPIPERVVKLLDNDNVMDDIQQRVEDKVKEQGTEVIEEEFFESEISTLINAQSIAQANISDLQIVIEPEYLELYGRITSPIRTVFILKVKPEIKEEKLYLIPKSLQVGALKLPVEWIIKISNLKDFLDKPIEISKDIKILDLELKCGKAKVKLEVLNVEEDMRYIPSSNKQLEPETI